MLNAVALSVARQASGASFTHSLRGLACRPGCPGLSLPLIMAENLADIRAKVVDLPAAVEQANRVRTAGGKVVFTNGCFDLLHAGHVRYLWQARSLGDMLIVGLNSDASVAGLGKGPGRPLVPQEQRAEVLAALAAVDLVVIFGEPTPLRLIKALRPEVLVKGGDWEVAQIVGAEEVMSRGGRVESLPLVKGLSTTALLERIGRCLAGRS